jgi:hypothetical protein
MKKLLEFDVHHRDAATTPRHEAVRVLPVDSCIFIYYPYKESAFPTTLAIAQRVLAVACSVKPHGEWQTHQYWLG